MTLVELVDSEGNVTGTFEQSDAIARVVSLFERPDTDASLEAVKAAQKSLEECNKFVATDKALLQESIQASDVARASLRLAVYDLLRSLGVE